MKSFRKITVIGLILIFGIIGHASALDLGMDITIDDGYSSDENIWYGMHEDDEVEPGCQTGQVWDLEGFYLNEAILTMVGGYDFKYGYGDTTSGDIFIDITSKTDLLYEYVIDLDFLNDSYIVYALDGDSILKDVKHSDHYRSNPWQYDSGGTEIGTGFFNYYVGLSDTDVGGLSSGGTTHNALMLNLSNFVDEFGHGAAFNVHFTMSCGNDNLMGSGVLPSPEPATMVLFGVGLIGLGGIGRKRFGKK